ncbi:MBG domain-containing protein, partial [Olsenella intestinalis]|uniref:MBG domain-containing protein n=1 Tax=Olsenella intestinalis TaxID=2930083 RepID=UPI0024B127D5
SEIDFALSRQAGEDVGEYAISVTLGDNPNYDVTATGATFKITAAKLPDVKPDPSDETARFVVEGPENTTYNGQEQRQLVTIRDKATGATLVEGTDFELAYPADVTNAGTKAVKATGKGNYDGEMALSYEIARAKYTVTTDGAEKTYDGSALTAPARIDGLVNHETATIKATGSQTEVGSSENGYELTWDGTASESNYELGEATLGTLTVTAAKLPDVKPDPSDESARFVVEGPENTTYNGQEQRQPVTIRDKKTRATLVEGTDFELAYPADVTNAGAKAVRATGKGNYAGEMALSYEIARAKYAVTTDGAEKTYDGSALTAPARIDGLVNGETATIKATGSQTEVGSSENGYELTWDGTASESNYELDGATLGTLTVTAAPAPGPAPTPGPTPTPGPLGPTTDGGATAAPAPTAAAAPAAPAADATPAETIVDDAVPMAEPQAETIEDEGNPLAGKADHDHGECWVHWAMGFGILLSLIAYGIVLRRRRSFTDGLHDDGDSIRGIKRDESNEPQGSAYGVPAYKEV